MDGQRWGGEWEQAIPAQLFESVCDWCLRAAAGGDRLANDDFTVEGFVAQVQRMASLVGELPLHAGWRREIFLRELPLESLREVIAIAADIPTNPKIQREFGTWADALRVAGVYGPDTRSNSFGIQSRASDGHLCHSLGERLIDDWLTVNDIPHGREPYYPGSSHRGDFLVGDIVIEFFGLAGIDEYDAIIAEKRRIAATEGLVVIDLYQRDINDWEETMCALAARLGIDNPILAPTPIPSQGAPEGEAYIRLAQRRAPVRHPLRDDCWLDDPLGVEHHRYFDGRGWTRHVVTRDGHQRSHTPTVRLPVRDELWQIFADEDRSERLRERATNLPKMSGPDRLEFLYAWMDAAENHAAQLITDIRAMGEEPWSPIRPWREPYVLARDLFDTPNQRSEQLAVVARESEARGVPQDFERRLRRLGHTPDEIAAGLAIADP